MADACLALPRSSPSMIVQYLICLYMPHGLRIAQPVCDAVRHHWMRVYQHGSDVFWDGPNAQGSCQRSRAIIVGDNQSSEGSSADVRVVVRGRDDWPTLQSLERICQIKRSANGGGLRPTADVLTRSKS